MATDYGHDLACVEDLEPTMLEIDGRRVLSEALVRRLLTSRGGLIDDPDYGFLVSDYLNDDIDARAIGEIASFVDAEFMKDERVLASSTTVQFIDGVLILSSSILDGAGPFKLVLAVAEVSITVLKAA